VRVVKPFHARVALRRHFIADHHRVGWQLVSAFTVKSAGEIASRRRGWRAWRGTAREQALQRCEREKKEEQPGFHEVYADDLAFEKQQGFLKGSQDLPVLFRGDRQNSGSMNTTRGFFWRNIY
jgi:hypothetical protein